MRSETTGSDPGQRPDPRGLDRRWALALVLVGLVAAATALWTEPADDLPLAAARRPAAPVPGAANAGSSVPRPESPPTTAPAHGRAAALALRGADSTWVRPDAAALAAWSAQAAAVGPAGRSGQPMPPPLRQDESAAARAAANSASAAGTAARPAPRSTPWTLIGFVEDRGRRQALIVGEQGTLAVSEGDALRGGWRVRRLEPDAVHLIGPGSDQPLRLGWRTEGS